MSATMAKRGRGRPRKIESDKLPDKAKVAATKSDEGEVVYSDEFPEFFKIYVPATCSQTLRIPADFLVKLGGDIPRIVRLRRPICDGMTWEIYVERKDEHWCFQNGWPQFVKENSLQDGDFLTFSYVSTNSMFYIKAFARNGCRKRVKSLSAGAIIVIDDDESISPESLIARATNQ